MKQKSVYICSNCDHQYPKWMGQCGECGAWNTLEEKKVLKAERKVVQMLSNQAEATKLGDVEQSSLERISTGFTEMDNAIGGGIVADQVLLFSGEPGIGKSTILLQILTKINNSGLKSLYMSGEESPTQVKSRASRIFPEGGYSELMFVAGTSVGSLLQIIEQEKVEVVVVDSIQTIFDETVSSLPGSLSQVKSCTSRLVSAAKQMGFILILVGHINKDGGIAGPKVLEHLVDTVVQFEGERSGQYRVLRVLKNRFGSTGEVGLFVMESEGLADLTAEHNIFDTGDSSPGVVRTVVVEGNRPLVVEVQALINTTVFAYPKRVAEGISVSRLQLICAILERFSKLKLADKDIYVRTTGGYKLGSTSSDLAVAAAIISSTLNKSGDLKLAFSGELSLGGKVNTPTEVIDRLTSAMKFGIDRLVTGRTKGKTKKEIVEISSLADLRKLF